MIDLNVAVTRESLETITASLPPFPVDAIRTSFAQHGVKMEDCEAIPRKFAKYFTVMAALAGGNLKGKRVLDVGSGLGVFLAQAKCLGMIPTGLDLFIGYEGLYRQGAMSVYQAYGHALEEATFVQHDITQAPFLGQFDFVTSFGMLEHIYGKDARKTVVQHLMASVAPGGSLILTCGPNQYFPIDLHHYGPTFVFYHCLPVWARRRYLQAFAKTGRNLDPKYLNGMRVREIKGQMRACEPAAQIVSAFPLWVRLAKSQWLQRPGVSSVAMGVARLLSAFNVEPVIILVATVPGSK